MIAQQTQLEDCMASRPTPLTLRAHHDYRSWTTDWRDDAGHRRMKRFGREGLVSKKVATAKYQNWLGSEWNEHDHVRNPTGESATYTVKMMADAYEKFAVTHYVKRGKPTSFMSQVSVAMDRLRDAYGHMPVCQIVAPMIARLRDKMIFSVPEEGQEARALMRNTVNDRLHVIKQAFSWAHAEKGRVSIQVAWSISGVRPLAENRTAAKESVPVPPIADAVVARTLRHCSRLLADMIRLQRLTGMRPEEACIIRGTDVEANGEEWLYRPEHHKTEHHGKKRVIPLGKRAQRIVKRRLKANLLAYLFTPAEAVAEFQATTKQRMRTRCGPVYTTRSYRQAIHRACTRAGIEEWNPNQLRHAWATEVRKAFGIEATAVGLGHSDIRMAEVYAERDIEKAKEVARKVG